MCGPPVASAGCLGPDSSPSCWLPSRPSRSPGWACRPGRTTAPRAPARAPTATPPGRRAGPPSPGRARARAAAEAAERHRHPHRRPRQVADAVHAQRHPADPRPGRRAHQLLRRAVQLLPVAGLDPVRPLRPQPRRDRQRLARGRLRPLEARPSRTTTCRSGSSGPATAARCSASTSTSTPTTRAASSPTRRRPSAASTSRRAGSRGPRPRRATPTPRPTTSSTSTATSTPTSTRTTSTSGSATGRCRWSTAPTASTSPTAGQFLYYASYSPHTPYAYPPEYESPFTDATYPRDARLRRGRRLGQVRADPDPQAAVGRRRGDDRRDLPRADPVGPGARPDRGEAGPGARRRRARSTTPT